MKARDRDPERVRRQRANLQLRHYMRTTYSQVDRDIDRATRERPVSCRKGCAACCRQLTGVTLIEAQHIAASHPDIVGLRAAALRDQAAWIAETGDRLGTSDLHVGDPRARIPLADAWWDAGQRCVFLADDNTCTVYEARPLACRTWLVTTDPALCASAEPTEVQYLSFEGAHALSGRFALQSEFVYGYLPHMMLLALAQQQ